MKVLLLVLLLVVGCNTAEPTAPSSCERQLTESKLATESCEKALEDCRADDDGLGVEE